MKSLDDFIDLSFSNEVQFSILLNYFQVSFKKLLLLLLDTNSIRVHFETGT